jgi:hypothetical protein
MAAVAASTAEAASTVVAAAMVVAAVMAVVAVMAEAAVSIPAVRNYQRKAPEYTGLRVWDRPAKRGTFS